MTDNTRRTLRNNRKPPHYLSSQVALLGLRQQDGDPNSNIKQPPPKESKPTTLSINAMAKILSKFINQINQRYKEVAKTQTIPNPPIDVKIQKAREGKSAKIDKQQKQSIKKIQKQVKNIDDENTKKNKQLYKFKNQYNQYQNSKSINRQDQDKFITREALAANAQENAVNLMTMQYSSLLNSTGHSKNQHLNINTLNPHQMTMQQQMEQMAHNQAIRNQFLKTNKVPYQSNVRQGNKVSGQLASDAKLFKRASYHVAIAYNIHVKNIKNSGKQLTDANDIDPTYPARLLRERSLNPSLFGQQNQSIGQKITNIASKQRDIPKPLQEKEKQDNQNAQNCKVMKQQNK